MSADDRLNDGESVFTYYEGCGKVGSGRQRVGMIWPVT